MRSFLENVILSLGGGNRTPTTREVYEQADRAQRETYDELRQTVLRFLYVKTRLEVEVHELRADVGRAHARAIRAARQGERNRALVCLEQKGRLQDHLADLEEDLDESRGQLRQAEQELFTANAALRSLRSEKIRAVATVEAARARRKREERTAKFDELYAVPLGAAQRRVAQLRAESELEADVDFDERARIELARFGRIY